MVYIDPTDTVASSAVNEVTALNNNWDMISDKISLLNVNTAVGVGVTNPVQGLESWDQTHAFGVYTGTAWRTGGARESWGAWTNMNISAPYVPRTTFTPQLRLSDIGRIQMRGGIVNTAAGSPWPGGMVVIHDGQFPSSTHGPVITSIQRTGGSVATAPNWSYGQLFISNSATNFLKIFAQFVGSVGGGNFLVLDDVEFWVN